MCTLRLKRVDAQSNSAGHGITLGIGHIKKHHTRLASLKLRGVTRLIGSWRAGEKLPLAGYVFILDRKNAVRPGRLAVLQWIDYLYGLQRRREA